MGFLGMARYLGCQRPPERWFCFKVGIGSIINIWEELWIPNLENFQPTQGTARDESLPTRIQELIDPYTRSWKIPILNHIFLRPVVQEI